LPFEGFNHFFIDKFVIFGVEEALFLFFFLGYQQDKSVQDRSKQLTEVLAMTLRSQGSQGDVENLSANAMVFLEV
jgi:hypothetical protein